MSIAQTEATTVKEETVLEEASRRGQEFAELAMPLLLNINQEIVGQIEGIGNALTTDAKILKHAVKENISAATSRFKEITQKIKTVLAPLAPVAKNKAAQVAVANTALVAGSMLTLPQLPRFESLNRSLPEVALIEVIIVNTITATALSIFDHKELRQIVRQAQERLSQKATEKSKAALASLTVLTEELQNLPSILLFTQHP